MKTETRFSEEIVANSQTALSPVKLGVVVGLLATDILLMGVCYEN